jgi:TonB family protein
MFFDFFGLREDPFGVTPETRFLYPSSVHEEARASLLHSFQSGRGFVVMVGQPGMGKTTLLMDILHRLKSSARTALLFQTQCNSHEFLEQVMLEFNLGVRNESLAQLHDRLRGFLANEHSHGKRTVIVVDEAQNLKDEVLETVRLLSDFETQRTKLLHIVLSGQPQLADKLMSHGLLQLRQRIGMVCRLLPLTAIETREYIQYRLMVAGRSVDKPLFSEAAYKRIAEVSKGIPRNINNICFHSLSIAYPINRQLVGVDIVDEATADIDVSTEAGRPPESCVVTSTTLGKDGHAFWHRPQPRTPAVLTTSASQEASTSEIPSEVPKVQPTITGARTAAAASTVKSCTSYPEAEVSNAPATSDAAHVRVMVQTPAMQSTPATRVTGVSPAVPISGFWKTQPNDAFSDQIIAPVPLRNGQSASKPLSGSAVKAETKAKSSMNADFSVADRLRQVVAHENIKTPQRTRLLIPAALIALIALCMALWAESPRLSTWFAFGANVAKTHDKISAPADKAAVGENGTEDRSKTHRKSRRSEHVPTKSSHRVVTSESGAEKRTGPAVKKETTAEPIAKGRAEVSHSANAPVLNITEPLYPPRARALGIEGTVVLDTVIGSNGKIISIHPISGKTELIAAASDAVRRWTYDPHGLIVLHPPVHETVKITFTLR